MNEVAQRRAAREFASAWQGKGYEKGESQPFWLQLLGEVLGVEHPAQFVRFEGQVRLDHTSFIDAVIPSTHVLIEQKSIGKNLRQAIRQSDGSLLTPFQQAKRYTAELPYSERPRWIVISNFEQFHIYDMEKPHGDPEIILLKDLPEEYYRLQFLVGKNDSAKGEMEVSLAAGAIVGKLYDALLKQYRDPGKESSLRSLNMLCVRLVFCFYAEDAGIFEKNQFKNYVARFEARDLRRALMELFKVLDIDDGAKSGRNERDPYLDEELAAFPYVNGGLFEDEEIEIPQFTDEIRKLLVQDASADFDWRKISPTIFGAVFESTLNPETRRSGGMHYTSIENIHKVIDPLFLDDLRKEFAALSELAVPRKRREAALAFQKKLGALRFLDPACGSGNFLTETYISLRQLENEALKIILGEQIVLGDILDPIMVSIKQFYGIEINDFAVSVAKTALWIAENQMLQATEDIISKNVDVKIDFLPLKTNAEIVEGNALRMDWEEVVPKEKLDYIMGNPPFVGGMMMTRAQHDELANVFPECKKVGEIDYVAGWYAVATNYMQGTRIQAAFVSTNSICQGQSVAAVWKPLLNKQLTINFAYRTFRWDSEASLKAHVHCVIVGFSTTNSDRKKFIFDESGNPTIVQNINPYLINTDTVFIENISDPLCDVPAMKFGSMPRDGGGFILSKEDRDWLLKNEPLSAKWIKSYLGANEFLKGKERWCLWLKGASPKELRSCPAVMERINKVKEFRQNSKAAATRKFAEIPHLFCQIAQPESGTYIAVPKTSSERRKYLPMGFLSFETIASDLLFLIPNATLYHFGILTSNVHMAWMRAVAGRLKSDYRYSKDIVYNNFPWPSPTDAQKEKIARTAQAILDARAQNPESSLADLYDELTMPPELRRAHQANDRAVMEAYGFWGRLNTEAACVAELMKMYEQLAGK